jgi:exodeoxyribonuclease VII large subunit
VEKRDGKIVAEIRGNIWNGHFNKINKKFQSVLNEGLSDNMTVICLASIKYHPVYGLSLNITDMDPNYTLGELAREKAETLKKLENEKIIDLNKQKQLPLLPKNIAVISVETSKGYLDFVNVIENNSWNYKFHYKLFPAILQGAKSVITITKQLKKIEANTDIFDALVIIRGGGGEIGLSSYDNYQLAKAVATYPIPVLTGIGHATNQTVTEMVSYESFITPTKMAEFLIQKFHNFASVIDENSRTITEFTIDTLQKQKTSLRETARLFKTLSGQFIQNEKNKWGDIEKYLSLYARQRIENEKAVLLNLEGKTKILSPKNILKRGYSITRLNGKAVNNAGDLKPGDKIESYFIDGKASSIVEEINK